MKLNKFPALLLLAVMALVVTSCEKEYWDEYTKTSDKCAFEHQTASFAIPTDDVTVVLKRNTTEGELIVPVSAEDFVITYKNVEYDEEDITDYFYCPETVTFADGSATAEYTVSAIGTYHYSGYEHSFTLVIDDEFRSPGDTGCVIYIDVE